LLLAIWRLGHWGQRGRTDGGWHYDYDACTAPLDAAAPE